MWFLRAIELADGWACRHGSHEFDRHPELQSALDHLREIALGLGPSVLYVHRMNGRPEVAGDA